MTSASVPFLLIGNPANRRVTGFIEALRRCGQPDPVVVSWADLARDGAALLAVPDMPLHLRIDSPGEDPEVEAAMLRLGYGAARAEGVEAVAPADIPAPVFGRILAPRQQHIGFLALLDRIDVALAARRRWRPCTSTAAIRLLFDKRLTSRRWRALGLPVPLPLEGAHDPDSLRAAMDAAGVARAWIKLASGSSASCIAIFERRPGREGHRERLTTTVEVAPDGRFNSLRLHRTGSRARTDAVLSFLLREGAQVEADTPKRRIGGRWADLRVLTIAGEPVFTVVRTSRHPITNLHLGGQRGDPAALRAAVGARRWAAMLDTCRAVARTVDALHLGIDVGFLAGQDHAGPGHAVFEANAFGDLLPGLSAGGRTVYEREILAITGGQG